MGGTMTKVLPGLYIGGLENAKNEGELIANCISHILVVQTTKKELEDRSPSREYLHISISERDSRSLIRRIPETNTFIHSARSESGNVLVCSESGISTNSAVVAAYLMTVYALDSRSAVSAVQGLRHVAIPIPSLLSQLDIFGVDPEAAPRGGETSTSALAFPSPKEASDLLITAVVERQRLKQRFGDWPGYEEDVQQLEDAISSFTSLSESGVLLRDPTSPLPEVWMATSCANFELSSSFTTDTTTQSSHSESTLHPTRSTTTVCESLMRPKTVKFTPPSTPPSTPVCFTSDEGFIDSSKNSMTSNTGPTAAVSAGDLSEQDTDFLEVRDCSPPVTLNETDLFPGDAPIIGIDDFAARYCQKVAERGDSVLDADKVSGDEESAVPYEFGVEVTCDTDADGNCDEDDDVPGAIEIRTGFRGRPAVERTVAASYHIGLPVPPSSLQRREDPQSRQQTTATAADGVLVERQTTSRIQAVASGRLSTTAPVVRGFPPFFGL